MSIKIEIPEIISFDENLSVVLITEVIDKDGNIIPNIRTINTKTGLAEIYDHDSPMNVSPFKHMPFDEKGHVITKKVLLENITIRIKK